MMLPPTVTDCPLLLINTLPQTRRSRLDLRHSGPLPPYTRIPPEIVVAPALVIVTLPPLDPFAFAPAEPSAPLVSMTPVTVILPPLVERSTRPPPKPVVLDAVVIERWRCRRSLRLSAASARSPPLV